MYNLSAVPNNDVLISVVMYTNITLGHVYKRGIAGG